MRVNSMGLLERIVQLPLQTRQGALSHVDLSTREVSFSFSSETPVPRKYGMEILSHSPGSLDTSRLDWGVVPFLRDHDFSQQCGKIVRYELGRDKNFASAKLFRTRLGQELFLDIEDGRHEISVGYLVNEMQLSRESPGQENNVYTATKYSIHEISSVVCPADPTIGVGHGLDEQLANRVYACRVLSGCGQIMWGERDEILEEVRNEWLINQELEWRKARDDRLAKIQYFIF